MSLAEEQRKAVIRIQHRADVRSGRIDIGPKVEQKPIEKDIRDMRDPTELGKLLTSRVKGNGSTAHDAADVIDKRMDVPNYKPDELTSTVTRRQYQDELKQRAESGDRFAISMLTTGKPGDSDE